MQYPKTLIEFMDMFPTEDDCRRLIVQHRWPNGFVCSECGGVRAWFLHGRELYECAECHYQGSVTAGTIFHKTRTDLRKWLLAIWLLASTKKAPSAAELSRQLGVTHKTAWLIRRKIQHAMKRRDGELMLRGIVEMDEGFIGGKEPKSGLKGRYQPNKVLVAVSAEQTPDGRMGRTHMRIIKDAKGATLTMVANDTIDVGSVVQTDGFLGYNKLHEAGYDHQPRTMKTGKDIDEWLPWSHIALSNFKRWTLDAFHGVSPEHLQAYMDEYCYRLNRRSQRLDLFRRIINRCVRYSTPTPYSLLTAT